MSYRKIQYAKAFGGGDGKEPVKITNQHRQDWNAYVKWLETQGLKGDPRLDKGDFGKQVLLKYRQINPTTSISPEMVQPIQADFANLRNYSLDQIKQKKAAFAEGVNEQNFMQELSKLDAYPGSKTTLHSFPFDYMRYVDKPAGTDTTINRGFVQTAPK